MGLAAGAVGLFGGGGGIKDALLGKKGPAFAPHKMLELDEDLKQTTATGRSGQIQTFDALKERMGQDTGAIARGQIERGMRGISQAAEDAQRQTQARIAQRGMGRSSIGINAAAELSRKAAGDKASLMGSLAERQDKMKRERIMDLAGASNRMLATPGAQRTLLKGKTPERSGGLLDIVSKVAGPAMQGMAMACWVAREIFGENNPKWLDARNYVLNIGPKWFKNLYLKHGKGFAKTISEKPILKKLITPLFVYFAWRGGDKKTLKEPLLCLK